MSVNSLTFAARSFRPRQGARCCRTGTRRSEEHTSELQSQSNLVCRLLLEKKKKTEYIITQENQARTHQTRQLLQLKAGVHEPRQCAVLHPRLHKYSSAMYWPLRIVRSLCE